MEAKILKTENEYQEALDRILELDDPEPGTSEGDEMELLLLLVEDYEAKYIERIPDPHPVAAIKYIMEENGLRKADLGRLIDSRSHATEIINLDRPLSLNHVRIISSEWNIPAEILIQPYETRDRKSKTKTGRTERRSKRGHRSKKIET